MGFFSEFNIWLTNLLARYIGDNTAAIAQALQPAIVTLGAFYVVIWGYLQLTGKTEEPFVAGVKRLVTLALILGVSLHLWLYNEVIVDTFFTAPAVLAADVIHAPNAVGIVDEILFDGDDAASLLLAKGGFFSEKFTFYLAGFAVYVIVGLLAVYTMFLMALSKIALSVLIAMGPIFIALLFFESTKRYFEAWIAQLSNYAFLTILTVMVAALMLQVVTQAAQAAVAAGGGIEIAHALKVCVAAGLTFLIMKQVPSMAQGVASGVALSSMSTLSGGLRLGLGLTKATGKRLGDFSRGAFIDQDKSRWDNLSRKAGQRLIGLRMPREKRPRVNSLTYQGRR
jgi:type IV secretion system protein VirB6